MLNLGLNEQDHVSEEHLDLKDELIDLLTGEDMIDRQDLRYDEMSRLYNMITSVSDESVAIEFLSNDPIFVKCFGTDDPKQELINQMTSSNENLLQDFIRWGVGGMIAGAILARLSRIRSICAKARMSVDQEKMDKWTARSIYLPPVGKMKLIMTGLEGLADGIESTLKDPKFDLSKLSDSLRACGIDVSYKGDVSKVVTTDWSAVAGSAVGRILLACSAIGAVTGAGLGAVLSGAAVGAAANILGGHVWSKNGERLADKGYTKGNLVEFADRMVKLIDRVETLKRMKAQQGLPDDAVNLSAKLRFIKKAIDVLVGAIKNVGRGLAAAIGHVS